MDLATHGVFATLTDVESNHFSFLVATVDSTRLQVLVFHELIVHLLIGNNFCMKPDTTHKYVRHQFNYAHTVVTPTAILQHARSRSFMENHIDACL
jgi:hypothetical protein